MVKLGMKLLVIDDLANRPHECNILVDHGIFHNLETRYDSLLPSNCKKLLGPKFGLLTKEYSFLRKTAKTRKKLQHYQHFYSLASGQKKMLQERILNWELALDLISTWVLEHHKVTQTIIQM